jgi:pimeloyl-ACP methyl ester carboxylesterase
MLGYRAIGDGPPLACLPGGPGRAAEYLGDLGGLAGSRRLILLDPRGVGLSADPADPATFGVDRLVDDVDALRVHLGLDQMDVLAHSAGSVLATLYAARHPDRVSRLVLVTPGLAAVGLGPAPEESRALLDSRSAEPWYPAARTALDNIMAGSLSIDDFGASRPFFYGRWDAAAQAHATVGVAERHQAARLGYFAGMNLDPAATAATVAALRKLTAPVLLYAGDRDPMVTPAMVAEAAPLFGDATVGVQQGAAHFPWIDNQVAFTLNVGAFLNP